MESRGKTLFVDIDGTIVTHAGNASKACWEAAYRLEQVLEHFNDWSDKGYRIILTTGRNESMRQVTEDQLRKIGLFWDMLIMGIGGGERILINDMSPKNNMPKAIGINLTRDEGFINLNKIYHKAKVDAGAPNDKEYTI